MFPVDYPDDERRAIDQLNRYAELRRSRYHQGSKRSAVDFVTLLLKKRLLSSTPAFANTLAEHRATMARVAGNMAATDEQMQAAWERAEDESGGDDTGDPVAKALRTAIRGQPPLSAEERELLDGLESWAEGRRYGSDARAEVFLKWLRHVCRDGDGRWNDERVIVFTEYRDTQKWLHDLLLSHELGGDGGERIALLYGGMDQVKRERTKAEFQAHPSRSPVRDSAGHRCGFRGNRFAAALLAPGPLGNPVESRTARAAKRPS